MDTFKTRIWGSRSRKIVTTATTLFFVSVAVGLAAWLLTNNGSGSTRFGSLQNVTITATAPNSPGTCYPGGECEAAFSITNPNSALIIKSSAAGDGTGFTTQPLCPFTELSVNALSGLNIAVPNGTSTITVPGAFHLASSAPTQCQGEIVRRDVALTFSTP